MKLNHTLELIECNLSREILSVTSDAPRHVRGRRPRQFVVPTIEAAIDGEAEVEDARNRLLRLTTPILPRAQIPIQTPQEQRVERRSRAELGQQIRLSSLSESGPGRSRGHPTVENLATQAGQHVGDIMRYSCGVGN